MPELHFPWLEISILLPLCGAIACTFKVDRDVIQQRALIASAVTLFATVAAWIDFISLKTFEAGDHWNVFGSGLGGRMFVVDELSAPLIPLVALLYLMAIISTLRTKAGRFSFGMTLVAEAITLATLSCHEPWMIVIWLSLATIPPWFELRSRGQSTAVYTAHMGLFVMLLIAGWSLVDPKEPPQSASPLPGALLAIAVLLRAGCVPTHCWLIDLFENATLGTALLFVTPMTGAYAVLHLVLPHSAPWATQCISVLSLVTAVYAAGMGLVQSNARRFFGYLFLSHSSLVLAGLEFVNPIGMTGALCVWISVGLSLGGFGLTLRSVESRIGRISLDEYYGLFDHTPTLASLFLITGLSSIGFPGTLGFVGMELLVEGAVNVFPLLGVAVVITAALNSISILKAYFHIFTGKRHLATIPLRSQPSERFAVLVLTILILGGGLWPQPGVSSRYHSVNEARRRDNTIDHPHAEIHDTHAALVPPH